MKRAGAIPACFKGGPPFEPFEPFGPFIICWSFFAKIVQHAENPENISNKHRFMKKLKIESDFKIIFIDQ